MFCLCDDKGVIHKPWPEGGWVGAGAKGFYFKLFHKQACYERANGGTCSSTLDLFIILTMEEEVSVSKAELQ